MAVAQQLNSVVWGWLQESKQLWQQVGGHHRARGEHPLDRAGGPVHHSVGHLHVHAACFRHSGAHAGPVRGGECSARVSPRRSCMFSSCEQQQSQAPCLLLYCKMEQLPSGLLQKEAVLGCTSVRAFTQLCLVVQNGFNISTVSPNKGLALDLKKLIMSSADPVSGGALSEDVTWHRSLPLKAPLLTRMACFFFAGAEIASGHLNAGAALALVPLAAAASTGRDPLCSVQCALSWERLLLLAACPRCEISHRRPMPDRVCAGVQSPLEAMRRQVRRCLHRFSIMPSAHTKLGNVWMG